MAILVTLRSSLFRPPAALAGGARWTAGVFTVTNAVLLRHRIAVEERALATVAP